MSENKEAHYYEGDYQCPLEGSDRCCRDRHQKSIETRIHQGEKLIEIGTGEDTVVNQFSWEPAGKTRLYTELGIWRTELAYNRDSMLDLEKKVVNNKPLLAHVLDIRGTRTPVDTIVNPNCPVLKLARERKI